MKGCIQKVLMVIGGTVVCIVGLFILVFISVSPEPPSVSNPNTSVAAPAPASTNTAEPLPSDTPVPTETPLPTETLLPAETPTTIPTSTFTSMPTNTLLPTSTPLPTETPTAGPDEIQAEGQAAVVSIGASSPTTVAPAPTEAVPTLIPTIVPTVVPTIAPTLPPTPEPAVDSAPDVVFIVLVNKSKDEIIEIVNYGPGSADIGGWRLTGSKGDDRCTMPQGTVLAEGEGFLVVSGEATLNGNGIHCSNKPIWNNNGETIYLHSSSGELVMTRD